MALRAEHYYWVECDHPGCDESSPHRDYEVTAWSSKDSAQECALAEDWRHVSDDLRNLWLCPDHAFEYCRDCGQHVGHLAGEQDYLCDECVATDRLTLR